MSEDKRILIFEPIPTDAEFIDLQLRKAGIMCTSKRAGTKEMFEKVMAEFMPDIVIADNAVPRCDVLALVRRSSEQHPETAWVIVAGSGSEDLAVEFMKAGAADYVPKKNIARLGAAVKAATQPARGQASSRSPGPGRPAGEPKQEGSDLVKRAIESTVDLIAITDLEGRRIYNSPSYSDLLEEPDTLEGTSSFVDVHPDDREKVKKVFEETVATGIGHRLEYRLMGRDGTIRTIESQGNLMRDSAGKPQSVVIVSRDVSDRQQVGEAMRLLEEAVSLVRGIEYFHALVRALAEALSVRYALASECSDKRGERVRAIAYWASGNPAPLFEYDVRNTTCEQVVRNGKSVYYPADVQNLFPEEAALTAMNAFSYMGAPLLDLKEKVIGHLFVMHDGPLLYPAASTLVLGAAAARASAELELIRSRVSR